jgi:hypothetical protein
MKDWAVIKLFRGGRERDYTARLFRWREDCGTNEGGRTPWCSGRGCVGVCWGKGSVLVVGNCVQVVFEELSCTASLV